MRCDLHPRERAKRRCDHCGAWMCKACRSYDRGLQLCPVCARAVDRGFAVPGHSPLARLRRGLGAGGALAKLGDTVAALEEIPGAVDRALPSIDVEPFYGKHEPSPLLAGILSAVVPGLGQVYNGRLFKAVLIFCTSFLFVPWVWGIVDAAAEASRRARRYRAARYALAGSSAPSPSAARAALKPWPVAPPRSNGGKLTEEELRHALLRAAAAKGGEISVTEGVLETGQTFEDVQKALDGLLYKGVVDVDNRPGSGVVIYRFHELADQRPAA